MVDEQVGAADLRRRCRRRLASAPQPGGRDRPPRLVLQLRPVERGDLGERRRGRAARGRVDGVVVEAEPVLQPLAHRASTSPARPRAGRRHRSGVGGAPSTASSRSSASSESSKSASRVTRKAARSRISMPGKSRSGSARRTSSSGTRTAAAARSRRTAAAPPAPSRARSAARRCRGRARARRAQSERPEMYGNGWPGPTPSGVSSGKISPRTSLELGALLAAAARRPADRDPRRASAGPQPLPPDPACRAVCSCTRARGSRRALHAASNRPPSERRDRRRPGRADPRRGP